MPNETIEPVLYRHYKGRLYSVLNTVIHTETGETMVLYYDFEIPENGWYVRPASMWFDQVGVDETGHPITRFTRCE